MLAALLEALNILIAGAKRLGPPLGTRVMGKKKNYPPVKDLPGQDLSSGLAYAP